MADIIEFPNKGQPPVVEAERPAPVDRTAELLEAEQEISELVETVARQAREITKLRGELAAHEAAMERVRRVRARVDVKSFNWRNADLHERRKSQPFVRADGSVGEAIEFAS